VLWLLSVTTGVAAQAHRPLHARAHITKAQAHTLILKKLARQATSIGTSFARVHKVRASLVTRRAHFERGTRSGHVDDDDAIQNDAPAAHFDVDPFLTLRQLGVFVETFEQRPFTLHDSPRSPRGPPAAA